MFELIAWLNGNGSCYTARRQKRFCLGDRSDPAHVPAINPRSNDKAEALVRSLKRDRVRVIPRPDAQSVIDQLLGWFVHFNEVCPHVALVGDTR